jgi:VIT1/CCC1 family predicted Fe2+/Mn2+ transporter
MDFASLAQKEYRNFIVFSDLAKLENNEDFKSTLTELADFEEAHYLFWQSIARPKAKLTKPRLGWYRWLRKLFGITFIVRYMEREETEMIETVREYLFTSDHPEKKTMEDVIYIDEAREQKLLKQISEDRVEFLGSIVLGLNDGLIELSGALTGFTFAFQHTSTIVLAGFILGISASLSMASSAYLQARHEKGKDPVKSAIFTGLAYIIVVLLLIMPFLLIPYLYGALAIMIAVVILIVAGLSFYTSTVFGRKFKDDFREMFIFSIGTAFVSFLISLVARELLGIQV